MGRTHRLLGKDNRNRQPEPLLVECAPEEVPVVEHPIVTGVQTMIRAIMVEQKEETSRLVQEVRNELIAPVVQPELNKEQSEERNPSRTIRQVKPRQCMRDNAEEEFDRDGCKYVNLKASQTPSLSEKPKPTADVDWFHEMDMEFGCFNCSDRQKTIFVLNNYKLMF